MKLKFTTKLFIACCAVAVLLRTLQIIFLTEADIRYLKSGHTFLNVLIYVLPLLLLLYTASNAALATRVPLRPGNRGWVQFAAYFVSGALYVGSGAVDFARGDTAAAGLVFSLIAALFFMLLAASAVSGFKLPKVTTLFPIAFWVYELVVAYLRYTEHSLRVRTGICALAAASTLLFFLCAGKILCSVDSARNYRIMYPLGLITAVLCFTSVVPELIARLAGYSASVSEAFMPESALAATGIFAASLTLSTFKRSNTVRRRKEE